MATVDKRDSSTAPSHVKADSAPITTEKSLGVDSSDVGDDNVASTSPTPARQRVRFLSGLRVGRLSFNRSPSASETVDPDTKAEEPEGDTNLEKKAPIANKRKATKLGRWNAEARSKTHKQPHDKEKAIDETAAPAAQTTNLEDNQPDGADLVSPVDLASTNSAAVIQRNHKHDRRATYPAPSPASSSPMMAPRQSLESSRVGSSTNLLPLGLLLRRKSTSATTNSKLASTAEDPDNMCYSSGTEAKTHQGLALSSSIDQLGPLVKRDAFICVEAVDAVRLLALVRKDLLDICLIRGGNCLVEERWDYSIKGKKGIYKVLISYTAVAALVHPEASSIAVDPRKPVAVELAVGIPGLMSVKSRREM